VDAFAAVRVRIDGATTLHSQAALADFMESGAFATHVRRMRGLYGEREAALLHHAARQLRGAIDLPAPGGGLQLAARFVRQVLAGRTVRLEPLDPARHGAQLYAASHGPGIAPELWLYLSVGPFASEAPFLAWLEKCAASKDPLFLAVIDQQTGRAVGMVSY